jgi:methionyl-tRNA synthetase
MLRHTTKALSRVTQQLRYTQKNIITTPIFYVNGDPHIGHLYSAVLADVVAHYHSIKQNSPLHIKNDVIIFSTGTDEHGSKVEKAAKQSNTETQQYCDLISARFKSVFDTHNIRYTDYIRTTQQRHKDNVRQVWNKLLANGDLYQGEYQGWYCTSDESFHTNTQVVRDGDKVISPVSGHVCEWVTEKTFKFKLSKYKKQIREWLEKNPNVVRPVERYNQVLTTLDSMSDNNELDLSVSRPKDRVKWGIDVPEHDDHVIYVWFDALMNYLTIANQDWNNANIIQILGKDILKFHTIYWPALLLALDLPLPNQMLIHSYWTVDGVKMSKSLGNVLSPEQAVERVQNLCGKHLTLEDARDYLRYYLMRESNISQDSNLSQELIPIRMAELADVIGNLLLRLFSAKMHPTPSSIAFDSSITQEDEQVVILALNELQSKLILCAEQECDFRLYIESVLDVLRLCNQYVNTVQPWIMLKQGHVDKIERVKFIVAETLRCSAIALYPILPARMIKLLHFIRGSESQIDASKDWSFQAIAFGASGYTTPIVEMHPPMLFAKK